MTEFRGYTWNEFIDSAKMLVTDIKQGKFPIEGTTEKDYLIIGKLCVYTPYIPLTITDISHSNNI